MHTSRAYTRTREADLVDQWRNIDAHLIQGTQMAPLTEMHQGIEIRYGYSITDDLFHAHFDLPAEREGRPALQRAVLTRLPEARLRPGKGHFEGPIEDEVLIAARSAIDRYLGPS
jgi:hypothetical protein